MELKKNNTFFKYSSKTDIGAKRTINEDAIAFFESQNGAVWITCDGMGGHKGGQLASNSALKNIQYYLEQQYFEDPKIALLNAINYANLQVFELGQKEALPNMGTTIVVVIIREHQMWYAHIGDSRLYQVIDNQLNQLTKDHSYVQYLLDKGAITESEAEQHPYKNRLTRALGVQKVMPVEICEQPIAMNVGDTYLICTDGLTNMVPLEQIKTIALSEISLEEKTEQLITYANFGGGNDNISITLITATNPEINTIPEEISSLENILPDFIPEEIENSEDILTNLEVPPPTEDFRTKTQPRQENVAYREFEKQQNNKIQQSTQNQPAENKRKFIPMLIGGILVILFFFILAAVKTCNKGASVNTINGVDASENPIDTVTTSENIIIPEENITQPSTENNTVLDGTFIDHTIEKGETIDKIAGKYHIDQSALLSDNNLDDNNIKLGDVLKVRITAEHTVKSGELLSSIASKYKISKDHIMKTNSIKDETKIREGQKLTIPIR